MIEIKYREQNGEIVPYLDIVIDDDYAYLNEVLISPFVKNDAVIDVVRDYLSQCGFTDCAVRCSHLPVR